MARIIDSLAEISGDYDALFCDLWGVVHDGVTPFAEACAALTRFRETGGRVVLLTNAPRPRAGVATQLDQLGVPRSAWDTIATSGDSARLALFEGVVGQQVWHIGEPRDLPFFEPLHILKEHAEITRVPLDLAEGIVCTGPFDPNSDPDLHRAEFEEAISRGLKFLCANPDIVVDRGGRREWCAGALAALYTKMGGESLYFGKPHGPVYALARMRLRELGSDVPDSRILAVGDGPATDVIGAIDEGLDCLFVTGGLMAAETETDRSPDPAALAKVLEQEGLTPAYAIGRLR